MTSPMPDTLYDWPATIIPHVIGELSDEQTKILAALNLLCGSTSPHDFNVAIAKLLDSTDHLAIPRASQRFYRDRIDALKEENVRLEKRVKFLEERVNNLNNPARVNYHTIASHPPTKGRTP